VRIAYFDCYSGISGDMTLGALVDAGIDAGALQDVVRRLEIGAELSFENVKRGGFRATYATVKAPDEHAHRHLHHVDAIIDKAGLPSSQSDLARRIFRKLAEAEARVHGSEPAKVHFHEVGAVDSIVDIVCAAVGIDVLGVDRIEASALPPGRGSVWAAHGRMPLPAPGTAELLRGIPIAESTADFEQTTPTGAAILATVAKRFGPLPAMTLETVGYGAGSADPKNVANVVRLFVGQSDEGFGADRVWVLETNLDDIPGEMIGHATTRLLAAGALDVFVASIQMKKNRPGVMLSVICDDTKIPSIQQILFRETSTLGIRRYPVERQVLERETATVETPLGPIQGKLAWPDGRNRPARFSPEYDACARIATERGIPLLEVYQAAQAAYSTATKSHDHEHKHSHIHLE
jgi:uncharacterized protein (TIGR00299 family) protein